MTKLIKFDAARIAIEKACSVDEVKNIRDKAEALRAYLKQTGESLVMQNQCAEIKLRAERRGGELFKEIPREAGGAGRHKANSGQLGPSWTELETAEKESGVGTTTRKRWEAIADIPEEKFEEHITSAKANEKELTESGILKTAHVSHNSGDNEWYTPKEYIEAARSVMGAIDVDPASSDAANRVVRAAKYYTVDQDGLKQKWEGRTFMNPPYAQPLISDFCNMLIKQVHSGDVCEACVLVNNATETAWFQTLAQSSMAICFPKGRIKYWSIDKELASPLQGQAVIYIGTNEDKFIKTFSKFGVVVRI